MHHHLAPRTDDGRHAARLVEAVQSLRCDVIYEALQAIKGNQHEEKAEKPRIEDTTAAACGSS